MFLRDHLLFTFNPNKAGGVTCYTYSLKAVGYLFPFTIYPMFYAITSPSLSIRLRMRLAKRIHF
jgi:hypothetical protein